MDKLIQDLGAGPILVTDLLEHQPVAGPPSQKGDVTALFSDGTGALAIDRDNRRLLATDGTTILVDWAIGAFNDASGVLAGNLFNRQLLKSDGTTVAVDWENGIGILDPLFIDQPNRNLFASDTTVSVDWENHLLVNSGGTFLDWSTGVFQGLDAAFIDQANRTLINSGAAISVDWENRLLNGTTAVVVDWSASNLNDSSGATSVDWEGRNLSGSDTNAYLQWENGLGFFGIPPTAQPVSSGAQTAGALYTATEQTMLQEVYDAVRALGLMS